MTNKRNWHILFILFCGIGIMTVSGCGKKGPPQPPEIKGHEVSAPFNLRHSMGQNKVHLSWQHQVDKEKAFLNPDGFEIFMARKTGEGCEGCPFKFNLIGFASMPSLEFTTRIEKGFIYYFRVRAVSDDETKSNYSKTIQFEHL